MTPDFPLWAAQFKKQHGRLRAVASCLHQFEALFSPWIPRYWLAPTEEGDFSRQRLWPLRLVFWTFLWQVAQAGASCREAIRQAQALCLLAQHPTPPETTSPYCQARGKLPVETLQSVHQNIVDQADSRVGQGRLWQGLRVLAVDGTCLSAPDTPENQKAFPQQNVQKPGCGFPTLRLLALFSLATGMIVAWATGTWYQHELTLLPALWEHFRSGDVLLGDRGFGNWTVLAQALQRRIQVVCRVNTARRRVDFRQGQPLGRHDRLVSWKKPRIRPHYVSKQDWAALPDVLNLRVVRVTMNVAGFRTRSVILVTTLLDPKAYPAHGLGQLYFRRWAMELCLRDLKETLQMDVLSCQTPENLERELRLHLLIHNLVRRLMLEAAARHGQDLDRLSFAGALAMARRFAEALLAARNRKQRCQLQEELFRTLAADTVPCRPGRREPRAIKRRPKPYPLLTCPRRHFRDIPHRNRYRAAADNPKKSRP